MFNITPIKFLVWNSHLSHVVHERCLEHGWQCISSHPPSFSKIIIIILSRKKGDKMSTTYQQPILKFDLGWVLVVLLVYIYIYIICHFLCTFNLLFLEMSSDDSYIEYIVCRKCFGTMDLLKMETYDKLCWFSIFDFIPFFG